MSFLPSYCFASKNVMSMVLPCSSVYASVIIIDIIKLIISMVIIPPLVFHLESSNENVK